MSILSRPQWVNAMLFNWLVPRGKWLWSFHGKRGKSEGFDSCDWPSNLTQIGFKSLILRPCDLEIWWMTLKIIWHVFYTTSSFVYHFISISEFKLELQSRKPNLGHIRHFFSCVTLPFDVWPWKTIRHLFYASSSFVYHIVSISKFKLELQSGNAQFGSNWKIFESHVTFKFDGWPWKIIGHLFYATSSFVHHFIAIGEFKLEIQSGNAQFGSKSMIFLTVWPCNLTYDLEKHKRTSLYAISSFVHRCIGIGEFKLELQSGNTHSGSKWMTFFSRVTLLFVAWPWNTIGHLFFATSSFVHHFIAMGDFKLEIQSGNAQSGSKSTILRAVWPCHLTYDLDKQ